MAHLGLWGVALMYLLEGMAAPWPIEIPLWLSGDLIHQGQASYWQVVFFTWLGSSLGNIIAFAIARIGGQPLLTALSGRFRMERQVAKMQSWIDRFGLAAVIFTRWINWGFGLALWLMGFSRVSPYRVLPAMLINTAIWCCVWVALGRVLISRIYHVGLPGWLVLIPGGIFLLGFGGWQLARRFRRKEGTECES